MVLVRVDRSQNNSIRQQAAMNTLQRNVDVSVAEKSACSVFGESSAALEIRAAEGVNLRKPKKRLTIRNDMPRTLVSTRE